jgi:predicted alpha/beta-hydrolase family hydrolase
VNTVDQYTVDIAGRLHGIREGSGSRGMVIISHGAGRTGMATALLEQTAIRLAEAGFSTLRWNFSFVDERRAPSAGSKREKADLEAVIDSVANTRPLILVGKSFGARVSSYVAAERSGVDALVFYGLPIHGLGKNAKPRDWSNLAKIAAPMLFITGDRDQLCSLDRLAEVQTLITAPFDSEVIPGDHSYKPKSQERAIDLCVDWLEKRF